MTKLDQIIYDNKSFSSLLKEIHTNHKEKEKQISALIGELKPLIKDVGDATLVVPLIKEYMDIGIKNDDHLIKMAGIVQRAIQKGEGEQDGALTDKEKQELLKEIEKYNPKGNKKS